MSDGGGMLHKDSNPNPTATNNRNYIVDCSIYQVQTEKLKKSEW